MSRFWKASGNAFLPSSCFAGAAVGGATIFDNFDDNSKDVAKWGTDANWTPNNTAGGTVVEANSDTEVTPPSGTAGYTGRVSLNAASFVGKSVIIQRTNGVAGNSGYERYLRVGPDANNGYGYLDSGGSLFLQGFSGGTKTNISNVADPDYSTATNVVPPTYSWIRLRHDNVGVDDIVIDGAPSTASAPPASGQWTELLRVARSNTYWNSGTTPNLKAAFGAGQWGSAVSPPAIKFDNFATDMAL